MNSLTATQQRVLTALTQNQTLSGLAFWTDLDTDTLGATLADLIHLGLVRRHVSDDETMPSTYALTGATVQPARYTLAFHVPADTDGMDAHRTFHTATNILRVLGVLDGYAMAERALTFTLRGTDAQRTQARRVLQAAFPILDRAGYSETVA